MNAIFAKQWLWRNEEDLETESVFSQGLNLNTYEMYHRSTPYSRI